MSGERKERTEWHRVVIFNERLPEITEKYLRAKARSLLEGALQIRKWTDQGGQERYVDRDRAEPLPRRADDARRGRGRRRQPMEGAYDEGYGGGFGDEPAAATAPARARNPVNDLDDDIPF